MSEKEKAMRLINLLDEEKIIFIIRILESLMGSAEIPNETTLAAMQEGDEMLRRGTGERYTSIEALFADLEN